MLITPRPLPISLALFVAMTLSGCNFEISSDINSYKNKYLSAFLNLHEDYCEKRFDTQDSLKYALTKDKRFKLANGFDYVYETNINKISYAISPEKSGCTTDVMIRNQSINNSIFNFKEINKALLAKGYMNTAQPYSRKNIKVTNYKISIVEKTYISPKGEITTLTFPLTKQDKYYMTLFTEKFSHTIQPGSSLKYQPFKSSEEYWDATELASNQ